MNYLKRGMRMKSALEQLLKPELKNIMHQAMAENRNYLMEHECKKILEGIGVTTTGYLVAGSSDEAVTMSSDIGYPVVMKIVSPDVVHKTDEGGVKLNLTNADQVRAAYQEIVDRFKDKRIAGIAVQKMAKPGQEAIIGVTRDPVFGPMIMFGLGGIFVEVLKDVSFRILPITGRDAAEMIEEIKGYAVLKGARGQAVDIPAVKSLLIQISQLVMENPEIAELDLNPLFLYTEGYSAVDARMFISEPVIPESVTEKKNEDLRDFFYPHSIAVLGASDVKGKLGYNVFWNLTNHNFAGKLYPINPGKDSVLGVKAYKSILDVPDAVDLAIVVVPAKGVVLAIEECCSKDIRFVVVITAGFAETGEQGKIAQSRIGSIMREKGCRILGPNCAGVVNTLHNMVQSIGLLDDLEKGNVGMIAQAGVYASGILTGLRKVQNFGIVATIGNKMDISETDILEYLTDDDQIKVVAMYMEDVRSGKRFVDVASRATVKKPVIVLKAGRTEAGKKAVSSHTASLAGNDEVNSAAFRQSGIIRARDNEHLFGLIRAFSKQPLPKGDGTMVITYTGSLGVAATDTLYAYNMRLAILEPEIKNQIKAILPDFAMISNPIDCSFSMTPDQVRKLIELGREGNDVHSFLVVLQGEMLGDFVEAMKDIDYKGKPVVCCVACKEFMIDDVVKMEKAGIPVYSTAEMAAEILSDMYYYNLRKQNRIAESITRHLHENALTINRKPVHLRLIEKTDVDLWTDFVKSCSDKSLRARFHSPFHPTPEKARRFCNLNPEDEIAIVAEMHDERRRSFIGIARLNKSEHSENEAEFSVIVSDSWQKNNLGRLLSTKCIEVARQRGFNAIRVKADPKNTAAIKIVKDLDFQTDYQQGQMLSMSLWLSA
jgi:acetate---CoA ligase (ADP-forming)